MAAAATITIKHGPDDISAKLKVVIADYQFGTGYTAGGDAITPGQFGLSQIHSITDLFTVTTANSTGFLVEYDKLNLKLKLLWGNAGSASILPDVGTSDQSAVTRRILVIGF